MRFMVTLLLAGMLAAGTLPAEAAEAAGRKSIHIPAQALGSALRMLAKEHGLQLVYVEKEVAGRNTAGVNGELTVEEALTKVLSGTGLTFQKFKNGEVSIVPLAPGASPSAAARSEVVEKAGDRMQLVRAEDDTQGGRESDDARGGNTESPEKGIPEILVKGTKSLNTDIQRTEDDPQPYVVFDAADIERSQATSLDDFLKTRLPMNTSQTVSAQFTGSPERNFSQVNLRGLGSEETLILVDGRRMPGVNTFVGTIEQPDINGIPLSAIERIEVLPSTAGGIYGGGATGGVINIILKRDYSGMEMRVTYGNTFDSDVAERRIEGSGGFSLEGGRTRVMLTASYSDAGELLMRDRNYNSRARQLLMSNDPTAVTGSGTPPHGATVNIRSVSGDLTLKPQFGGAALGSDITHIPLGYAGPASDNGAALVANAGSYNLDLPDGLNGGGLSRALFSAPQLQSVSVNLRRSFGDHVEAFVDAGSLVNKRLVSYAAIVPSSAILPATAPNNPFEQDIRVRFPIPTLSIPKVPAESTTLRATAGVIASLPRDWMLSLEYGRGESKLESGASARVFFDDMFTAIATGLPSPEGRPALNVLTEGNTYPMDVSAYHLPFPNSFNTYEAKLWDTTLRFSGPLFEIPAGPITFSGVIARRKEQRPDLVESSLDTATADMTFLYVPELNQRADSYYAELRIPATKTLEVQASTRGERYKAVGTVDTFQIPSPDGPFPAATYWTGRSESSSQTVGLRYLPVSSLTLRASYGTGVRPPPVNQIAPMTTIVSNPGFGNFPDPKRGGATGAYVGSEAPFNYTQLGNPDLRPENSESWSAGIILTPAVIPGLRISVDYTRIDKTDEIAEIGTTYLMEHEDLFPGRVIRAELTPSDIIAGYSGGVVTGVNVSRVNFAAASVEAYDVQADYEWNTERLGAFHVSAIATCQPKYFIQVLQTIPGIDSVGFNDGPLKWRGNTALTWDRGPWTAGWSAVYYHSFFVYFASDAQPERDAAALNQGRERFPAEVYHDFFVKHRFDESSGGALRGLLSDTEVSLGIQNVFNKEPTIVAGTDAYRAYTLYGDPRLRRYTVSLLKRF